MTHQAPEQRSFIGECCKKEMQWFDLLVFSGLCGKLYFISSFFQSLLNKKVRYNWYIHLRSWIYNFLSIERVDNDIFILYGKINLKKMTRKTHLLVNCFCLNTKFKRAQWSWPFQIVLICFIRSAIFKNIGNYPN